MSIGLWEEWEGLYDGLANQLPGAAEASQAAPPSSTVAVSQGASISRIRWWPLGVAVSEARHLFLFFSRSRRLLNMAAFLEPA